MEHTELLRSHYERLERTLAAAVANLGCGRDNIGLNALLEGVDDMEKIVQICLVTRDYGSMDALLPILRLLRDAMRSADAIALTDALEFKLLPLIRSALEGVQKQCG